MISFKNIAIKVLLLISLLFVINIVYKNTFFADDISRYADIQDSLNKIINCTDILYFGSSSNYFCPKNDSSKRKISDYVNLYFPKLKVNPIQKGYMHAGTFLSVIQNIPDNSPVKTIIISVNLRSFGAFWMFSEVETSYAQAKLLMNPIYPKVLSKFLLSLDAYDNKTKDERIKQFLHYWDIDTIELPDKSKKVTVNEWDKAIATSGRYKNKDGSVDYETIGFACNIIKAFAYNIDTTKHPRIKDLDEIVKLAKKKNWNLIFNILPEDVEKADRLVGTEIRAILKRNRDIILNRYSSQGVTVIDNLETLNADYFYEAYPTEHYSSAGKILVAKTIANKIKEWYPNEYKDVVFNAISDNTYSYDYLQEKIEIIKNDSIWFKAIKEKAIKNNRTIDEQLILDGKWVIDNEKPQ